MSVEEQNAVSSVNCKLCDRNSWISQVLFAQVNSHEICTDKTES